jgi:hypothetical protein
VSSGRCRAGGSNALRHGTLLLLGVALALPLGASPVGEPGPALGTRPLFGAANLTSLAVTIAPASWWMVGGTTAPLSASWTGVPPGCAVAPRWFHWSVSPGVADGVLSVDDGSRTNFTATENASGTTEVVVRAAAAVACAGAETAAFRLAEANLTVDAPPTVDNLSVEPDPAVPGGPVHLNGTIVGGEPPYTIAIVWANGTVSHEIEATAGNFGVTRVLGPGTFVPEAFVVDRAGLVANATVPEPLTVAAGFAVALEPSSWETEVGVRVDFELRTANPPSEYTVSETCESVAPGSRPASSGTSVLSCRFGEAGPALVTVVAVDAGFPFTVATSTLSEPVAPSLSVRLPASPVGGEVGVTSYLPVVVAGGVPPFEIRWSLVGGEPPEVTRVACDGSVLLPVTPTTAGADVLSVLASDSLGVISENSTQPLNATSPLEVAVALATGAGSQAVGVNVSGSVLSGAAPFDWVVAPARSSPNSSALAGALTSPGSFAWNGTYRVEGVLPIVVGVVDALGSVWWATSVAPLVPTLAVDAAFDPRPSAGVTVTGTIEGGVAPYELWLNGSTGELWNGSLPSAGAFQINATTGDRGAAPLSLTVVDGWGNRASAVGAVNLSSPPASSGAASVAPAAGIVVGLVGAGVAIAFWRRRRPAADPSGDEPDPVPTLRAIIEPADGADRATVELLAEEEGIPIDRVRTTLDRLVSDGTIRSERGLDGEEVLAWSRGR